MKAEQVYISYNSNKSIEELQYNLSNHVSVLENLKFELQFYIALLEKPIFKSHILNLYENLINFKNELSEIDESRTMLLNKLVKEIIKISNKIECDDLACDSYFISEYDTLDQKIFNYYQVVSNFKIGLFEYTQSVFITK